MQRKLDAVVAVRIAPALQDVHDRVEHGDADVRAEFRAELHALRRHVDERFDVLAADLRRVHDDLRRVADELRSLRDHYGEVTFDLNRLGPQVAALEVRIADRERPDGPVEVGSENDLTEARRLLDDVVREHERIRVRFSGIALYEERLRKLEAARWPGSLNRSDGAGTA
ncbi:hypothetical protein [Geodermatophilus sp. SYSU D00805]